MNRTKMQYLVAGAFAVGLVWAGIASSASSTVPATSTSHRDYERAVQRMASPDFAFSDVALQMPEEADSFLVAAADSKTCSQRCSKRCSVGCTTTRGCSSRCKVHTDGCRGTGSSPSGSAYPSTVRPPASSPSPNLIVSPVTTELTTANVKRALIAEGYYLCVNDVMDTATREAIFEFQRKRRLVPTGTLDDATKEAVRKILEWMARGNE